MIDIKGIQYRNELLKKLIQEEGEAASFTISGLWLQDKTKDIDALLAEIDRLNTLYPYPPWPTKESELEEGKTYFMKFRYMGKGHFTSQGYLDTEET